MVKIINLVANLKMFIDGEWKDSETLETRPVINPANGEVISYAPEGSAADARAAIFAARRAFEEGVWSGISAQERAAFLFKIADKICWSMWFDCSLELSTFNECLENCSCFSSGKFNRF